MKSITQKRIIGAFFLGIPFIWLVIFVIVPIFVAFFISLTEYDIITTPRFVGLKNYTRLVHDPIFWTTLKNTIVYTICTVPLGFAISLGLAIFVNRKIPAIGIFRTLYYIPVVVPMVAISLSWLWLYDSNVGLINYILERVGGKRIPWLSSPQWAMPAIIIMSVLKNAGYNMVILLAGLQSIPEELYEAARIDGAKKLQLFRHITLPMLSYATTYVLITSIISSFQVFDQVFIMTEGGPRHSTSTIVYQVYRTAFMDLKVGYASAMAFVLFLILLIFTGFNLKLLTRSETYY